MPGAIAEACGGSDLTYSTFRRFPLRSPDEFTIPSNEGAFLIRVFMPIGGSFDPTMWCCLTWHDARRQPVVSSERFHITGNGLKRILTDMLAKPEEIDKLRTLDRRPRCETWVRWDWRALEVVPNCIEMPRWMQAIDPNDPDAAQKMNAFRQPTSVAEALRIKAEDKRKREAEKAKQAAGDVMPAEAAIAEAALVPENDQPAAAPAEPAQKIMSRDDIRNARNRRSKMAKATRSKVAADKADAIAAKAWGEKVIRKMEKEERP